jgi:hypothetical protein
LFDRFYREVGMSAVDYLEDAIPLGFPRGLDYILSLKVFVLLKIIILVFDRSSLWLCDCIKTGF